MYEIYYEIIPNKKKKNTKISTNSKQSHLFIKTGLTNKCGSNMNYLIFQQTTTNKQKNN